MTVTLEQKNQAEKEILEKQREISFGLREWSIQTILEKFGDGGDPDSNCELFIPDYQRDYKWDNRIASRFIESILLTLPIPYIYIADSFNDDPDLDGRVEIIDGSQRIRSIYYFVNNQYALSELKELTKLEGFRFSDLPAGRQRRFLRESLRIMELRSDDTDYKRDLFERINSGIKPLIPMEQRRGSESATSAFYTKVIVPCSKNKVFRKLSPLSQSRRSNEDYAELVLRFFAYGDGLDDYRNSVRKFLDQYFNKMAKLSDDELNEQEYITRFEQVMDFVQQYFPFGFKKSATAKSTSRTFFESIALGSYFAIKENNGAEGLNTENISEWFNSNEYRTVVTSDAANNTSKLNARINFVKDKLLGYT
ncbi:DUF262 domain-containing protein [Rodentibacter genomosp. 2]|uniref:GmrSD restriction endonucleases N-terminal domain-containing protein n=1 Tax=Rodentibacter genomosp. 2 TaxID=1908266 RepID=A0A1V3JBZ1_9PAST|nr:DUF262 domain-containing protein [Rodentibacter genomosp. 2]OOF53850.1 hypothetical protein BKK55_10620 [Rodentibacter genomosp. 2]